MLREEIAQLRVLPEKILRRTDCTYNTTVLAAWAEFKPRLFKEEIEEQNNEERKEDVR